MFGLTVVAGCCIYEQAQVLASAWAKELSVQRLVVSHCLVRLRPSKHLGAWTNMPSHATSLKFNASIHADLGKKNAKHGLTTRASNEHSFPDP